MSSFFNTTANVRHTTPLPPGTRRDQAVAKMLHDHAFLVQCGPHSIERVLLDADEQQRLATQALAEHADGSRPLPPPVRALLAAAAGEDVSDDGTDSAAETPVVPPTATYDAYRVTDLLHTLPAGLWDSRVVSTYEMTDMPHGVFVRIRSPMSAVMDTTWTVAPVEADGGSGSDSDVRAGEAEERLQLVEDIVIRCSRLLVGTIKVLCEGGWQEIHAKMVGHLET